MSLLSRIFSLPSLLLIAAIIVSYKRNEILQYARENLELCPKQEIIKVEDEIIKAVEDTSEVIEVKKEEEEVEEKLKVPKFWLIGDDVDVRFKQVSDVLERLGIERFNGSLKSEEPHKGWNLIWSQKTFIPMDWKEVTFDQKVNHFPGSFYLSSKRDFAVSTDSKYVPKAFNNSDALKEYAQLHKDKKFVVKSKNQGGIEIKKPESLNFTPEDEIFAQEFIENPMLFDGHKFDFSVYVVITSVEPFRLYVFPKNINIRFCSRPYGDLEDVDSYVPGETHITAMDLPAIRDYFLNGYTLREAFDVMIKKNGGDADEVWEAIEDCIRTIGVEKERLISEHLIESHDFHFPYFELFSFDFILDADFNPHLMKVNANPDISASGKYVRNSPAIENLLFNLFNLIQVGTTYQKEAFKMASAEIEMMVAHIHSRTILPDFCIFECDNVCTGRCKLCTRCQTSTHMYEVIVAYREQMSSGDFKRLFPPDMEFYKELGNHEEYIEKFDYVNRLYLQWFYEMCKTKRNRHFC